MSIPVKFSMLLSGFIFYCLAIIAQPGQAVSAASTGKTYAVIVGISKYQNAIIKSLDYADKDAMLFAGYLKSKAGGAVPDEQIKIFTNEEATIAAMYSALDWVKEQTTKDDLVYFYFSGHGDVEIDSANISKGFLLAYNSPPNNYINNAISVESINAFANSLTTQNGAKLVLITDACRSGKLAGDYYKGKQLTADNLRAVLNNQVRLASCRGDELAAEGPFWGSGRGVFSYYLLRGLYGLADIKKDGTVKLDELETFLDSSFKTDKDLTRDNHKQHPVFDGSPLFPLASVDSATAIAVANGSLKIDTVSQKIPDLANFFNPIPDQPIDYFFSLFKEYPFDRVMNSHSYLGIDSDSIPLKIIIDLQTLPRQIDLIFDSLQHLLKANIDAQNKIYNAVNKVNKDSIQLLKYYEDKIDSMTRRTENLVKQQEDISYQYPFIDSNKIELLKTQLLRNKSTTKRFIEIFISTVHEKAQDMINAYLKGDLAELEKRQYYYSGKRSYGDLLPPMLLAMQLIPENHQLARILSTQYSYISGLTARMKMATSKQSDSLLTEAFHYQYQAFKKEPYAAYIQNELGNLFMHKKNFDSAAHHYNLAKILSPTWAIPWSNFIRLNLAINNIDKAKEAIHVADSLQPNLAYVNINAGLIMEKEKNWLAAESYYLNAIAQNNVHYLPLQRLGEIYIYTGDYAKADSFLYEAKKRKDEFAVNEQVFSFGIELGGDYQGEGRAGEYYDELEDYYLLGEKYEKFGFEDSAILQYKLIASIENQRQMDQAAFRGLYNWEAYRESEDYQDKLPILIAKYGKPVPMGGSLKLAILYEKRGDYEKAEKILLEQVSNNRTAGYTRQAEMDKGRYGPVYTGAPFNYYWLYVNRDLEGYTYNFYKRVLSLFPRESNWFKNAGRFLYERLALTYSQISIPERPAFYEYSKGYAYPYAGSVEGPYQQFDDNNVLKKTTINYKLPGTGEEINFDLVNYDPLMESLKFLQQSVKLSGELQPEFYVQEKIADLQSWMGKSEEAIQSYSGLMLKQPTETVLRNKLIDILTLYKKYPAASYHLNTLYQQGQVTNKQIIELADYTMLTDKASEAILLLQKFIPVDSSEKNKQMQLFAKANWLTDKPNTALIYLRDSLKEIRLPEGDYWNGEEELAQQLNLARLYSIARMYAATKKEPAAISALKIAIDSGFNYRYVVNADNIWDKLRNKKSWKQLFRNWDPAELHDMYNEIPARQEKINYNPVHFRIPKKQSGDD